MLRAFLSEVNKCRILKLLVALTMGLTPFAAQPATAAPASVALKGVDLERSTVLDLQRQMDRGRLNSATLTAFYLRRIQPSTPACTP